MGCCPAPPSPHLCPSPYLCPLSLLICPRVYLCLFSRQTVCSGGFTKAEVLTGRGCGEDTPCPFLGLIGKSEVAAQGAGWNFALDDLAQFAGASPGTAGVRPGRKQAPACWLLRLPPHPLSPLTAASSQAPRTGPRAAPFPRRLQ